MGRKYEKGETTIKECPICRLQFEHSAYRSNTKYCSDGCRKEAQNIMFMQYKKASDFVIFERDNFRCVYCGKSSIEDSVKLEVEHIYPIKKGGDSKLFNVVTSCEKCNGQKAAIIMSDDNIVRIWDEIECRNAISGVKHYKTLQKRLKNMDRCRNLRNKLIF